MPGSDFSGWIPGVLCKSQLRKLFATGYLKGKRGDELFDHSSLDLTLSGEGYFLPHGAIKPFGNDYGSLVAGAESLFEQLKPTGRDTFVLKPKHTYLFRLEQSLGAKVRTSHLYGQATAKSSIGRVDVLARLIVDGMDCYEEFQPCCMNKGSGVLWVEITPITFPVRVKQGIAMTQLRLFLGRPESCELQGSDAYSAILPSGSGTSGDGCLTVDLSDAQISPQQSGCAFCAKSDPSAGPISLWEIAERKRPNPRKYWALQQAKTIQFSESVNGMLQYLPIKKDCFYILRSKQRISLPSGIAIYCRAIDETIGEMRIHYAGFVHPLFGQGRADGTQGTPLIFELRGHDVEVMLSDNEKLARLTLYRMSQDAKEPRSKATGIMAQPYTNQNLTLSKLFKAWR